VRRKELKELKEGIEGGNLKEGFERRKGERKEVGMYPTFLALCLQHIW
jgi:hypothetical protein